MSDKRVDLIVYMAENDLGISDVAGLLSVSNKAVRNWRSKNASDIPDTKFELLKLKVKDRDRPHVA